jgi:selenide, water dikinase
MGPETLAQVLRPLADMLGTPHPDLLIGLGAADDAAVYRLNDEQAVVATTDFFPPIVDDPTIFGAIAAANALSDVYAMGGDPLFCLNLVTWPEGLDVAILSEILAGSAVKVREAGALVAGGHTVTDPEPKFGLAVIGLVHPQRILTKGGARPGDALILTKPLGTGVVTTALKEQRASAEDVAAAVASMVRLNAAAARVLRDLGEDVHACTDVTGFGLLGHAWEMADQSGAALLLRTNGIRWLPGAAGYAEARLIPGGTARNRTYLAPHVTFAESVSRTARTLLYDPQTSGGLLAAVAPGALDSALAALAMADVPAFTVGVVTEGEPHLRVE